MTQALNLSQFANTLNTSGATSNAGLQNSTISGVALGSNLNNLTVGTGLSGSSYNGSSAVTIVNTGVTSIAAGTGISVSSSTGNVTITNSQLGGICRAWVCFSATGGTISIKDSYNVSSVSYISLGVYKINFTSAFANISYCWTGSTGWNNVNGSAYVSPQANTAIATWKKTTSLQLSAFTANGTTIAIDSDDFSVTIFG